MVCKRRLQRLRSVNWVGVVIVAVIFLGILLTYNTLSGQDTTSHLRTYFPSIENENLMFKDSHLNSGPVPINIPLEAKNLFQYDSKTQKDTQSVSKLDLKVREVLSLLYPQTWLSAKEADEMAIVLKDKMLALNLPSPMSCSDIGYHQIQGSLSYSTHKFVESLDQPRVNYVWDPYSHPNQKPPRPTLMAMKSQNHDLRTKASCLKEVQDHSFCSSMGNYLLMREIFLLRFLQHPNLIGLLGYCLRGDGVSHELGKKGLVLVLEMGMPYMPHLMFTLSWVRRLQLAHGIASLMAYLHDSPLGSVGLPQVKPKDFVLVDEKILKLTDLDDAELEERACTNDAGCFLESVDIGVTCKNGRCQGINQKTNLRMMGGPLLVPLLQNPPPESRKIVEDMLTRVRLLDISAEELFATMDVLLKKYSFSLRPPADRQKPVIAESNKHPENNNHLESNKYPESNNNAEQEMKDANSKPRMTSKRYVHHYLRVNSSNFPGQYDYLCPNTRVHWGCVLVADNLQAAMEWCSNDATCRSFVVFSTHLDDNSKIAVVFKSNNRGQPKMSSGTTLFLQQDSHPPQENPNPQNNHEESPQAQESQGSVDGRSKDEKHLPSVKPEDAPEDSIAGQKAQGKEKKERSRTTRADPWVKVKEMQACVQQSQDSQQEALHSREKRIMTAMGMKGKLEKDWRRSAQVEGVASFSRLRAAAGDGRGGSFGGSMLVHFNTSTVGHSLTQASFMVEKGPRHNHVAFAMLYTIDRLLGLYHVPPTVEGFLRGSVVARFAGNATWQSVFGPLTHPDGTLRGLFVALTPKTVKAASLTLQPLPSMTSEVMPFNRTQKAQLEYVLLWWLGLMSKPNNTHLGVKGYLLHVDGDSSFQDRDASYEGYFYYCQFPSVAYKMLQCFHCQAHNGCVLGQEVVRKITEAGFRLSDIRIPQMSEQDFPNMINTAASEVVKVVDTCIQTFGRDSVLY